MNFELNETQRMYQKMAKQFAEKEVKPLALEFDKKTDPKEAIPIDLYRKGLSQGFHLMIIPTSYGGSGLNTLTSILILEEFAVADIGFALTWHVNNIALTTLFNMGSKEQIDQFLKPIIDPDGGIAGLSTTEPDGGVTTALLIDPEQFVFNTKAQLQGEEWVINGQKAFASNIGLPFAKWIMIFCRVSMEKVGWASSLPILLFANTPGLILMGEEDKMGHRLASTQSLILDDVRVPKNHAIGAGGKPISGGKRMVTYDHDTAVSAIAIGCARAAFEDALEYAKLRVVLGKPLTQYQIIQSKLADMFIGIEAARTFIFRTAIISDSRAEMDLKLARAVKVFATETANRITYEAVQIFGGSGYCKGTRVEKYFRDQRVTTIYEGTNEALRINLFRLIEATPAIF